MNHWLRSLLPAANDGAGSDRLLVWWEALEPWPTTVGIILLTVLLVVLVRVVVLHRLERLAAATNNDLDDRLVLFVRRFIYIGILFVAAGLVLWNHGIEISPLLAGAGVAGIAVGLAAKETLADVLAGVFLIVDRPMRVGDRVKIERIGRHWGGWGDVLDVGLRRTLVRNTDGVVVNYPNNVLANSVITNFSHGEEPVRVRIRFQVAYEADLGRVKDVAETAIAETAGVLTSTAQIVFRSLWDDDGGHLLAGVLVEGRYRIADVRDRTRIRSAVLANVLVALRTAAIPMPAPRLRLESGDPTAKPS